MIYALYVKKPLKAGYYCNLRIFKLYVSYSDTPEKVIFPDKWQ